MTFLPVVQRELLVSSRAGFVRWQRFGAVGFGVLILLLVLTTGRATPQVVGERLFYGLGSVLWVLAWLTGPLFTTDALTREKREGTLGLLLLTDLRGYDLVLGKLAATALHQVMLLVGVLPVLALPVALGGISPLELWRVTVSLLLTQGLSMVVGIACSTGCRTFSQSLRATLGLLGGVTVLPLAVHIFYTLLPRGTPGFWVHLGPLMHTLCATADFQRLNPSALNQWGAGVGAGLILSGLALGWAVWVLRHLSLDSEAGFIAPERPSERDVAVGSRHLEERESLEENPYFWLERVCRRDPPPLLGWAWLGLVGSGLIMLIALVLKFNQWPVADWVWLLPFLVVVVVAQLIRLGLLIAGTRRLGEDLRSGALELLITTPLTPAEIVGGCRRALWLEIRSLVIGLPLFVLGLLTILLWKEQGAGSAAGLSLGILFVAGTVMLVLDCRWGIDIALRASLREADPVKALRQAVVRLLVPGWVAGALLLGGLYVGMGAFSGWSLYFLGYGAAMMVVRISARRARLDLEFGLPEIAAGVGFDTDQKELAEDFRRAAMTWEDRWFNRR